jgi:hypothetical protein
VLVAEDDVHYVAPWLRKAGIGKAMWLVRRLSSGGDLKLVFLVPNIQVTALSITNFSGGTEGTQGSLASFLVSNTQFTSGDLTAFLQAANPGMFGGLSGTSPQNPFGAFHDPDLNNLGVSVTGFSVYAIRWQSGSSRLAFVMAESVRRPRPAGARSRSAAARASSVVQSQPSRPGSNSRASPTVLCSDGSSRVAKRLLSTG